MKNEQPLSAQGRQRRRLFTGWMEHAKTLPTVKPSVLPFVARPPQSLPETLFISLCDGCGDCSAACPYGLLTMDQGRPMLTVDFTECDLCLKCTAACQSGALRDGMPADTTLRPQVSLSCLGRQNSCQNCLNSCPQQALNFSISAENERRLTCDDEHCNGCGLCKISCFHGHITLIPRGEKRLPAVL